MVEYASELSARVEAEDVLDTKVARRALRESEQRYRHLFRQFPIGVSITMSDGKIVDANKTLQTILGYSEEELKKINVRDLYEKPEQRRLLIKGLKRHGSMSDLLVRLKRKDGSTFDALISSSLVHVGGKSLLQTTVQDFTERKKIEDMLKESEEKYRNLFENAQDTIYTHDLKGKITTANKRVEEYGWRRDQFIGKNILDFVPRKYWPKLTKQLLNMTRGEPVEGEVEVITPIGKMTAEYKTSPIKHGERIIGVQTIIRDITERKKEEEATIESEEKFRSIFEGVAEGIVYVDKFGKILDANKKAVEIFGGCKEEIVGKRFTKIGIFTLKDTLALMRNFSEILRGKKTILNVEIRNKSLQVISLECSASLFKTGDRTMIAAVFRDVSERKKMEEALRQSEEKFKSLFERSPEAMAHVGPKFEILEINPRFTELFGYTPEEAMGKNLDSLIVPYDKTREAEDLGKKAFQGYIYHETVRRTNKGSLVPVSVSAAPIAVKGVLAGYVAVYKDISHMKKAEEALSIMNEKLRVIGSLTRHDARNRLTLVTTSTYLAKECLQGNEEVQGYLEKIGTAVHDVLDIFDFAKMYEMLGAETPTYIDVEKTVSDAASLFPSLKTVKVINQCRGLVVLADSLLRQAFYNLIDDSLKYAQSFTQIKAYYERADNDHLKLIYEDNGIGISLDKKPKLFQQGYTTGKGSGLGLYLIQKTMEIYGWTIQETGEPGKGARFVIEIPKHNKEGKELYRISEEI